MSLNETVLKDAKALISGLELPYLRELQVILSAEIKARDNDARQAAILKIREIAASVGLSEPELHMMIRTKASKHPRGPAPTKYRHPENTELHWSGRGRAPLWVSDWQTAHGNLDALKVAA